MQSYTYYTETDIIN